MDNELKRICERLRTTNDQLLLILKDLLEYEDASKNRDKTPPRGRTMPKLYFPHSYSISSYPTRYPPKREGDLKAQGEIKT